MNRRPPQSQNPPPLLVVDTSVWVAAFFQKRAHNIYSLWRDGDIRLACCQPVLQEYRTVLRKIPPIRKQANRFLQELKQSPNVVWIERLPAFTIDIEDPTDRKFLQCAYGANAQVLLSLDSHLLEAGEVPGVTVMRPGPFLDQLHQPPPPQPRWWRRFWPRIFRNKYNA